MRKFKVIFICIWNIYCCKHFWQIGGDVCPICPSRKILSGGRIVVQRPGSRENTGERSWMLLSHILFEYEEDHKDDKDDDKDKDNEDENEDKDKYEIDEDDEAEDNEID